MKSKISFKRLIFLSVLLVLMLFFVNSPFAQEKVVIKAASTSPPTHPVGVCFEFFKNRVEELSDGRIEVKIYSGVGGEQDIIQGVQLGNIDIGGTTGGSMINFVPEFDILSLPFLFEDQEHIHRILAGRLGVILNKALEERLGIVNLGYTSGGDRQILSTVPINNASEMKGIKIRTMNDPGIIATFEALGALPSPLAWEEVYGALQSGVIDAAETSFISWVSTKTTEVAKYGIRVNYMNTGRVYFINKKLFDSFSFNDQYIIARAMAEACAGTREQYIWEEIEIDDKASAEGATVIYPDVESFRKAIVPIYEKFEPTLGKEWIDYIRNN